MTIKQILQESINLLKDVAHRPRLESEILLSHFLNQDRIFLHINENKNIENFIEFFE
jgi:methylase of polypeptide subunit release factors